MMLYDWSTVSVLFRYSAIAFFFNLGLDLSRVVSDVCIS